MARRPHVLLIDELSFSLAPAICDRLFATIRDFADQGRLCVAASSSWMRSPRRAVLGSAARGARVQRRCGHHILTESAAR
jgi:hypothetical protein